MPIGLFWYGWAVEKHTHWIVPIIGTTFIGFGLMLIFVSNLLFPKNCTISGRGT